MVDLHQKVAGSEPKVFALCSKTTPARRRTEWTSSPKSFCRRDIESRQRRRRREGRRRKLLWYSSTNPFEFALAPYFHVPADINEKLPFFSPQLKEVLRRELEKAEQEVRRSTGIIADYKQVGGGGGTFCLFTSLPEGGGERGLVGASASSAP